MRIVLSGLVYLSPPIAHILVEEILRGSTAHDISAHSALSPREREVLQLVAERLGTKESAGTLGVSTKTIETHRQRLMAKLGLNSVAQLTKYAIQEGLTSCEP